MPTNEQRNEREKKYDRPNKVNKRASDRTRVANVTNEHAHARTYARTHIWTNDVGNISRKRLITIAFYTRVSAYAHLDLLSLSFLRLCLVVHVHISENSTLSSDKMLPVTLGLPGRK